MNIFRMLFVLALFILVNVYLFTRGWQAIPDTTAFHAGYAALYLFAASSLFFAIFLGNRMPLWLGRVFDLVGGYWMILFIFMLSAALLADLLRIINHYYLIFPDWVLLNYAKAKLLYLMSLFVILVLISVIGYIRFSRPLVKEMEITVEHDNAASDELNIVAVSDIHLGNLIRRGRLANWVNLINKQKPDVILLAGDIFDHNMRAVESQDMNVELARLDAKYGVYAIPGNHDYYAGIDRAISYMKNSGIRVLRDQTITIDHRMILIGRDDHTNRDRKPLKSLINGVNSILPKIVLDHQPVSLAESVENNIDLHLSGHTHNGQIFPFNLVVSRMYDLGYGYRRTGNTQYYVSSGLGLWGAPIRFGTQSEIVKIALKVR